MNTTTCPICGAEPEKAFSATVMNRHEADYSHCQRCGFIRAMDPHWLEEAHSSPVSDADTGMLMRNSRLVRSAAAVLFRLDGGSGKYLDAGGGYGILTRMLRDAGLDCYWTDRYCENKFARGFEHSDANEYSAVTMIEALEHVPDPIEFLRQHIEKFGIKTVLVTSVTYNGDVPARDWWYYSFETGQHVSFFSSKTFDHMAKQLGMRHVLCNGFHVLTSDDHFRPWPALLQGKLAEWCIYRYARKVLGSKTGSDRDFLLTSDGKETSA